LAVQKKALTSHGTGWDRQYLVLAILSKFVSPELHLVEYTPREEISARISPEVW
jgi:hypothetical protein